MSPLTKSRITARWRHQTVVKAREKWIIFNYSWRLITKPRLHLFYKFLVYIICSTLCYIFFFSGSTKPQLCKESSNQRCRKHPCKKQNYQLSRKIFHCKYFFLKKSFLIQKKCGPLPFFRGQNIFAEKSKYFGSRTNFGVQQHYQIFCNVSSY